MKNGQSHHRPSRHRSQTPDVICLPPPRPSVSQPGEASVQSRQMRRQARRTEMKAARRGPAQRPITAAPKPEIPSIEEVEAALAVVSAPVVEPIVEPETIAPLPRNRSLATQPRGLMRIGQWLHRLVRKSAPARVSPADAVAQLKAMRVEVSRMQHTLDRLLEGAAA